MNARLAFRHLLKAPGYASAAIATLALTIGASSAIFGAVHAVILKPLPIRQPEHLVICWASDASHDLAVVELSYRNFQDWTTGSHSFSQTASLGSSTWPAVLHAPDGSTRLSAAGVSVSFFDALGGVPELGRGFRSGDDDPKAPRVVVLSHGTWVTRLGADAGVVGTTLQLDTPHTIVGVMPEGFDFPRGADFWTPVVPILADSAKGWHTDALEKVGVLFVIGRLREGVTPSMARDELDRVAGQVERSGGAHRFGTAVVVTPFLDYLVGPARQVLWALFAAVAVLLLIGCANLSGLMLTRVSARRREHAVRRALGATGRALGSPWAWEAQMLSVAGGVVGLVGARWMVKVIVALAPDDIPRLSEVSINLPVAVFAFTAVLLTAVVCGAAPVRHAGRAEMREALNEAMRATSGRQSTRTRSLLSILQIGLAVVLLVASGLVVRSLVNAQDIDLGFVSSNVLTMHVEPGSPKPSPNEWVGELLRRVAAAVPEVQAAGAVYLRPLALGPIGQETWVVLEGQPDTEPSRRRNPALNYQVATPGYFAAMRIRLTRGRLFDADDTVRSLRVALVSEGAARRLWPGTNPVGRRLLMPTPSPDGAPSAWRTVVGVVSDVSYRGIGDARLDVYDAALQSPVAATDVMIRTTGDPLRVAAAVQAEARRLDPRMIVDRLTTLDAVVSRAMAPWRLSAWLFMVFAVLAVALATVGLVGVVSLDAAERRHEFAVRLALGATRRDVLRSVLVAAGWRALAGVAIGVPLAVAGARGIRSILFGVGAVDGATYVAAVVFVIVTVAVASYVPAREAAGIDPLVLLRRG